MHIILTIATIGCYLTASLLLAQRLARGAEALQQPKTLALIMGIGGSVFHAVSLYQGMFQSAGFDVGFFSMLSLIAWLAATLVLVAALSRPLENLGIAVLPFAALTVLFHTIWPTPPHITTHPTVEMESHILLSVLAYSVLAIAAVQSVLLAVQDKHLRNRHPGGFIRALPPLETMESLLFQLIGLGFVLLTLSLVSGLIYLEDMFAQHLVHKTILSLFAWCVFATLLWGRWRFGWRGRIAIKWTLAGFAMLMLAYLGSKLVLELVLHR